MREKIKFKFFTLWVNNSIWKIGKYNQVWELLSANNINTRKQGSLLNVMWKSDSWKTCAPRPRICWQLSWPPMSLKEGSHWAILLLIPLSTIWKQPILVEWCSIELNYKLNEIGHVLISSPLNGNQPTRDEHFTASLLSCWLLKLI